MIKGKQMQEKMMVTSQVAADLGISVATLRKYSLEIEKVTKNRMYFVRNNNQSRMYTSKNVKLLHKLLTLINQEKIPYKLAIQQLFGGQTAAEMVQAEQHNNYNMVDAKQVVQLLSLLQKTIEQQNEAISSLQKQMQELSQQNSRLLANSQTKVDKEVDPKILAMPDISGVEPVETKKTAEEIHEEILRKARENQQKHPNAMMHRTLADMQLQDDKHWWDFLRKLIKK